MKDRILITKELIPYTFSIMLGDDLFVIAVDYNATGDFFTLGLYDSDGDVIARSEKLVYGMEVFGDIYDPTKFPCLTIIPCDDSCEADVITWDNFGETVFLCIDDEEED